MHHVAPTLAAEGGKAAGQLKWILLSGLLVKNKRQPVAPTRSGQPARMGSLQTSSDGSANWELTVAGSIPPPTNNKLHC